MYEPIRTKSVHTMAAAPEVPHTAPARRSWTSGSPDS